jgi:hypothetical protein
VTIDEKGSVSASRALPVDQERLYIHFESEYPSVKIFCYKSLEEKIETACPVILPCPLNKYVYPVPLHIRFYEEDMGDMDFLKEIQTPSVSLTETVAVYDVCSDESVASEEENVGEEEEEVDLIDDIEKESGTDTEWSESE